LSALFIYGSAGATARKCLNTRERELARAIETKHGLFVASSTVPMLPRHRLHTSLAFDCCSNGTLAELDHEWDKYDSAARHPTLLTAAGAAPTDIQRRGRKDFFLTFGAGFPAQGVSYELHSKCSKISFCRVSEDPRVFLGKWSSARGSRVAQRQERVRAALGSDGEFALR